MPDMLWTEEKGIPVLVAILKHKHLGSIRVPPPYDLMMWFLEKDNFIPDSAKCANIHISTALEVHLKEGEMENHWMRPSEHSHVRQTDWPRLYMSIAWKRRPDSSRWVQSMLPYLKKKREALTAKPQLSMLHPTPQGVSEAHGSMLLRTESCSPHTLII